MTDQEPPLPRPWGPDVDPAEARARAKRVAAITTATIAAIFTAFALLPLSGDDRWIGLTLGVLALVATVPFVVRRMKKVLRSSHPFADAVSASAILFAIVVVVPAASYFSMATSDPTSFSGLETKIDAMYFSVVTMSTVGFGDITPLSQAARLTTTLHIVFTIALLGSSVRLLTWAARSRLNP